MWLCEGDPAKNTTNNKKIRVIKCNKVQLHFPMNPRPQLIYKYSIAVEYADESTSAHL